MKCERCERCGKPEVARVFVLQIEPGPAERNTSERKAPWEACLGLCASCARPIEDQLRALLEVRYDPTSGARRAP